MEARARRAGAAVGLAVALVAAVGVFYLRPWQAFTPGPAAHPSPTASGRPAVVRGTTVQQEQFVSASTGWVVVGDPGSASLFRTTDAGRHWQHQLDGVAGGGWALFFLDDRRGIVYASDQRGTALRRTTDGGVHWTTTRMTVCLTSPQLVFFLDLDHGWCVMASGDVPTSPPFFFPDRQEVILYRTTDGGASWTKVLAISPMEPAGGLTGEGQKSWIWFSDASTGWIGQNSRAGHAVVYATADAGDSWSREELPAPGGGWGSTLGTFESTPPAWGSRSAPSVTVAALGQGPRPDLIILTGQYVYTWNAPVWAAPVLVPNGLVVVADQAHWFVAQGSALLESGDGGENWNAWSAPVLGWQIARIAMVDRDHAWAFLVQPQPAGVYAPTRLARTDDAGRHWTLVTAPTLPGSGRRA